MRSKCSFFSLNQDIYIHHLSQTISLKIFTQVLIATQIQSLYFLACTSKVTQVFKSLLLVSEG